MEMPRGPPCIRSDIYAGVDAPDPTVDRFLAELCDCSPVRVSLLQDNPQLRKRLLHRKRMLQLRRRSHAESLVSPSCHVLYM